MLRPDPVRRSEDAGTAFRAEELQAGRPWGDLAWCEAGTARSGGEVGET